VGRGSLQCMLTGAVLVVEMLRTPITTPVFSSDLPDSQHSLSIPFGRSIHEVALLVSFALSRVNHHLQFDSSTTAMLKYENLSF